LMIMNQDLQAAIFPHASVSEGNLKKVLSLFERVMLFQPWFMDAVAFMGKYSPHMIQVLNPPERLKPGEEFRSLLNEYRQWIRINDDRGFPAFWAYTRDRVQDPRIDEIRGMIRNPGKPVEKDEKAGALQWHLTLHLAEELEEQQESMETLLRAVGGLDSPLKGALEDQDIPGLLRDMPDLEGETFFTEERLAVILDAWVSLYGEQIPGGWPLVTLKPQVLKYVRETWEEFALEDRGTGLPGFTFLSPDLSNLEMEDLPQRREAVFNGTELRQAVAGFCHDPGKISPNLKSPVDKPARVATDLQWTFLYLPPHGGKKLPRKYQFMKGFSGRVIGLVQETARHGQ
jgi:hypothetical protein